MKCCLKRWRVFSPFWEKKLKDSIKGFPEKKNLWRNLWRKNLTNNIHERSFWKNLIQASIFKAIHGRFWGIFIEIYKKILWKDHWKKYWRQIFKPIFLRIFLRTFDFHCGNVWRNPKKISQSNPRKIERVHGKSSMQIYENFYLCSLKKFLEKSLKKKHLRYSWMNL